LAAAEDSLIHRTLDARRLNAVANHPDVRPWIGGEGELDLTAIVSNTANFALEAEHGGWIFVRHEPGIYELHTLFLPEGRGRACLRAWREAERFMFAATDAREIVTRVPANNFGAGAAALICGFRQRFTRKHAFRTQDLEWVDVSYQALAIDAWWPRDPEALKAGELFHARLERAKALADSVLPDHPEDRAHDRAAGAACLMIGAGNPRKGAWFYNRWAALAGYPPIAIRTEAPLTIDVGAGVIVQVNHGTMEVIRCP
jgi:hypothetical protein